MRRILFLFPAVLICSCVSNPQPETDSGFIGLKGRWKSKEDSTFKLSLDRVGPGSKPGLEGVLSREGKSADLDPPSYARVFPIQKPDAAGSMEYAIEITLAVGLNGICAADGFVQDSAGTHGLTRPALPEPAALRLTFASRTDTGCDSLWAPMVFEKEP